MLLSSAPCEDFVLTAHVSMVEKSGREISPFGLTNAAKAATLWKYSVMNKQLSNLSIIFHSFLDDRHGLVSAPNLGAVIDSKQPC